MYGYIIKLLTFALTEGQSLFITVMLSEDLRVGYSAIGSTPIEKPIHASNPIWRVVAAGSAVVI